MGSPEKSWWFCVIGIDSLESIKVFIIATSKIKMKVFIGGVLAVGMRHYGKDELIVGKGYTLQRDYNNTRDCNAVAVIDLQERRGPVSSEMQRE